MAGKHDLERYMRALYAKLTDGSVGLNSFITAVNANVDDSDPQIDAVPDGAYSVQMVRDGHWMHSVFVVLYVADCEAQSNCGETLKKYTAHLELVFEDNAQDDLAGWRSYRYQRALEDFMESNWASVSGDIISKVTSLTPTPFIRPDRTTWFSVGVKIEFEIA
jgi:hypothetical protein